MKKNKIFVACDTTNIRKIKNIIYHTKNNKGNVKQAYSSDIFTSLIIPNETMSREKPG